MPRFFPSLMLVTAAVWGPAHVLADEDEDRPQFSPGLVAEYRDQSGHSATRIDDRIAFAWGRQAPDRRLAAGPYSVRWRGKLFVQAAGAYQFHFHAAGKVRLTVRGQEVLKAETNEPQWLATESVELPFGRQPLEIEFDAESQAAQIAFYWSGPQFQLEPVPARNLVHSPEQTPDARFERGGQFVRALRCAACHEISPEPILPTPSLARLSGNISPKWLIEWLDDSAPKGDAASRTAPDMAEPLMRRMPRLGLSRDDAKAIAAYLLSFAERKPANTAPEPNSDPSPLPSEPGSSDAGRKLFVSVGCLTCHRIGDLGGGGVFGGGDLTAIAAKRPSDFFARWLTDPAQSNPAHRMPVFDLSPREVADLSAYLATLGKDENRADEPDLVHPADKDTLARGARLVADYHCGACHELPEKATNAAPVLPRITAANLEIEPNCLGNPQSKDHQPGYQLSPEDREAVEVFLKGLAAVAGNPAGDNTTEPDGRRILAECSCLACHARDGAPGIAAQLAATVAAEPELAPSVAALKPPALFDVGDKLRDEALVKAITAHVRWRPWLAVRMPRFKLASGEIDALVKYFVETDRIPDRPDAASHADDPSSQPAGSRLVTADGFGCTSCHQIGAWQPAGVALNAHGPDLAEMGGRLRRPWYDRWMRNPARIVPQMEMPAVQVAVRGVLADNVDRQLAAVWQVLNQPGFEPPPAGAIRVVRASNLPNRREAASVLTDIVVADGRTFVKPLVVGLANRHNVLVDLEHNRLAGWWIGDTARQRTQGKSWLWEPAGDAIVPPGAGPTELVLVRDGKPLEPLVAGQFPTEFDYFEHVHEGGRFGQRLRFTPIHDGDDPIVLKVTQTITAIRADNVGGHSSGFRRRLEIADVPQRAEVQFRALAVKDARLDADGRSASFRSPLGEARLTLGPPTSAHLEVLPEPGEPDVVRVELRSAGPDKSVVCELDYTTAIEVDQFANPPILAEPLPVRRLDLVPGYEATTLPLPPDIMPTGLAWRRDGTLVISSLKGQVFLARDTDGDGLEDEVQTFCDGLAAPYGVAIDGDSIDVINKYALLRLTDTDGDGRADRVETLASGWGHSDDYHDWAVGLPRDRQGKYYVALPCQQDDRSAAAARLRGSAVRLAPREPTADDPRRFAVEPIAAGLRFPMGLALNRLGDLFATDNQGNYKPFNELNHLVAGRRYGFINKLEQTPGFRPPTQPPAIEIPHPWTRSVNGICFLYTPERLAAAAGQQRFGPFEGHLIGCEYDTRRLVRMSLEKIGDTYQGAVYPFSTVSAMETAPASETVPSANAVPAIESVPSVEADGFEGPLVCQVSPSGDLLVGSIRDSGWGAGRNTGSFVRLRPSGPLPPGIAEVRASPHGFTIAFTAPVDRQLAAQADRYAVSSYRRIATPDYGGPDLDARTEKIAAIEVAADARSVALTLDGLRTGFVYEFHLQSLSGGTGQFHPAEAYYTLWNRAMNDER